MSTYRIPSLEEFVPGFVFEVYSEGCFEDSIEDFCGWYLYTFGETNWRNDEEIKRELENGNIRTYFSNDEIRTMMDSNKFCGIIDIDISDKMNNDGWIRASGDCVCACGNKYSLHPRIKQYEWVNILCDGQIVKL